MIRQHPYAVVALVCGVTTFALLAWRPLVRWYRKVRRRRGGIYAYRTRKPRGRGRHWGYVGETVSFYFRDKDHMGLGNHGRLGQPWSDLDPVRYSIIKLPWWLCWKWVLLPLETLVMLCLWPVYNDAKNHWNPRRIPRQGARRMRMRRDDAKKIIAGVWGA